MFANNSGSVKIKISDVISAAYAVPLEWCNEGFTLWANGRRNFHLMRSFNFSLWGVGSRKRLMNSAVEFRLMGKPTGAEISLLHFCENYAD